MASVAAVHTKSIRIVSKGRGSDGKFFLALEIDEPGRARPRSRLLSIADYKSNRTETETALGLPIVSQKASNEFRDRVQAALKGLDTFDVAQRPGWHKGWFVLPNCRIMTPVGVSPRGVPGQREVKACLPIEVEKLGTTYRNKGAIKQWQELCRLAEGNSRVMMSIALAFAGPLGELLGGDPPMIQLVGAAESGKSSIAIAAGSVWGEHNDKERKSFSESWNNTTNNLEPIAAAHDATFLVLDETGLFESTNDKPYAVIKNTVMRLNRGITKGRKGQIGRPTWWMGILSTSNKSLDEMAEDIHATCPEALRSRLIDVPIPTIGYGAYETLHGLGDERSFSVKLQEIASNNYGLASVFFIRRLAAWRKQNRKGLNAWLSAHRDTYRQAAKAKIDGGGRKLDRVTESFATIYAAGCAAIQFNVLTWSRRELGQALFRCERAHVEKVADKLPDPLTKKIGPADAWRLLREYVSEHRSEFIDLRRGLREDDSEGDGLNDCEFRGNPAGDSDLMSATVPI
jgi:putative DNA primase/helicase